MCQGKYERKYTQYQIILEYLNGDKETINYNDNRMNTYKGALEIYRETKAEYKDSCVTIKFAGVTENGDIEILFEKAIINQEMYDEYNKANEIKEQNMIDLLQNLSESIEKTLDRTDYIKEQIPLADKNADIAVHNIQNYKGDEVNEKLRLFDELQSLRMIRLNYETDNNIKMDLFDSLNKNSINLRHIVNIITGILDKYKTIQEKEYVQLNKETLEQLNIMTRVRYTTKADKREKLRELGKTFDKVVDDTARGEIVCYNKANKGIKKVI